MGRAPCCDKANVKRGPWSPEEDATLRSYLEAHGTAGNWITLPQKAGLRRCGKSCRLRWLNYLRPDIKHGGFTEEENSLIIGLYTEIGSRWSVIASQLPGRTDNDVKNHWNTKLKKRLLSGKINLPTPNYSTITVNSISYSSSVGGMIKNELAPTKDYNYRGFPVVSGACLEPSSSTFSSTLLADHIQYGPSLMAHGVCGPDVGSVPAPVNGGIAVGENGGETNLEFGFSWDMMISELLFDEKASRVSGDVLDEVNGQSHTNSQH
ncbi:hypothetical protein SAY86_001935 [Trapa natans]|uniref:Uncharacterized protein n=1 Tax=Trapa natans TaxID=22666 RepID=A0AAN7LF60_TRANT|nr:hypothetical protein SAY86_001935 [Trapa natans]